MLLREFGRIVLAGVDRLFPAECLVCGLSLPASAAQDSAADAAVCEACFVELPWNHACCQHCAVPLPAAVTDFPAGTDFGAAMDRPAGFAPGAGMEPVADSNHTAGRTQAAGGGPGRNDGVAREPVCMACELRLPPWHAALAPLRYAAPVPQLVQALKFQRDVRAGRWLAYVLGIALCARLAEERPPALPAVVAVPMHPARARRRGFNHAALLAHELARDLALQDVTRHLQRTRRAAPQAGLSATERAANLTGAFAWRGPSPPPPVVAVVDDVLTTGATAGAVTQALLAAGSERVEVWCCARTPPPGRPAAPAPGGAVR